MSKSTKFYIKPLTRNIDPGVYDVEKILRGIPKELMKLLQSRLLQTTFSVRAKTALAKSINVRRKGNSIVVSSSHPAFFPLIEGQKKTQMRWLTRSTKPIPIITEKGTLIFRNAAAKSMGEKNSKGQMKWTHPGRKAQNIIEKARQDSVEYIKSRLAKELKKQIRVKVKRK